MNLENCIATSQVEVEKSRHFPKERL
jgi:hypothetical protein